MTHCYQAFGLNLRSSFEIPLLPQGGDGLDVGIELTSECSLQEEVLFSNGEYMIGAQELRLNVADTADFLVSGGTRILVCPLDRGRFEDIYVYILGSCLGAILNQRGQVCLHGSAVKAGSKAVLLAGESGAGKSTLSSLLCERGYPFLTDDVARMENRGSGIWVHPSYPQKRLWEDALQELRLDDPARRKYRITEKEDKYSIDCGDFFWNSPLELSAIVDLAVSDTDQVIITPLKGIAKMNALTDNTYRPFLLKYFGLTARYFDMCSYIIDHIPIVRIERPRGRLTTEEVADLFLRYAGSGDLSIK